MPSDLWTICKDLVDSQEVTVSLVWRCAGPGIGEISESHRRFSNAIPGTAVGA
jgi:hypothetical protein